MEVVAAASSIIAVIQITGTVVSICYGYQRGSRHYPKDVVKITHELQSLRNVLERLADIVSSQDNSALIALPTLNLLVHSGGPLEVCKLELKHLELKLAPAEGRFMQIGRALTWPLKEKDVRKILGTLGRHRGLFQLALTADEATMNLEIKRVTSRTEENLAALTERFQTMAMYKRNEQIFQWLGAPDPSSNHNKACQTRQRETGRWLLGSSQYVKWKYEPASFLWVHGIPGCGKTVLCSTIIDDITSACHTDGGNVLAYYYFDFNETKKQTCMGLARSLVTQLFGRSSKNSKTMETLFMQCGEGQREPTIESLAQALRELTEHFERIYLIMDALDECLEIPAVMSLIDEIRGWNNQNLHILLASRSEIVIERGLRLLITDQVRIQNVLVDADIKLLVRERLRRDPQLSQWSEKIKGEIEKTLYEGSKGMFRWTVCQLDTLRKCIKPSALRKALASLPHTLDDTYERILCSIDKEHAEDALKVLQWLAFSARPLELHEVAEATAITLDELPRFDPEDRLRHPTDILAICSSLISVSTRPTNLTLESSLRKTWPLPSPPPTAVSAYEGASLTTERPERATGLSIDHSSEHSFTLPSYVPKALSRGGDDSSTDSRLEAELTEKHDHVPSMTLAQDHLFHYEVRLAHDSVKEYLVSERIKRAKAAFYSISEASTNVFLAKSCLAYLVHFKKPLSDSTAEYLSEYPLLRYCAQEWEFHVTGSADLNRDTPITSVLKEFFLSQNSSFANWLVVPFGPFHGDFQHLEEGVDDGGNLKLEARLYHASRLGLVDICKVLLEQGIRADPPTQSDTGLVKALSTPLQISAHMGHEAVVRLLLDHGANINQRSVYASTLDYAVMEGREAVVCLLLERGARITTEAASPYYGLEGVATLFLAARTGHVSIVKLLLDNGKYPRARQSYSEAYREAITHSHQNVADVLLQSGADPHYFTNTNDSDDSDDEYFDV